MLRPLSNIWGNRDFTPKDYDNSLIFPIGMITLPEMSDFGKYKEKSNPGSDVDLLEDTESPFQLIVWNDEVNTFEWVIETLVDICRHSHEQAEQCAYLIHYKGRYAVKQGAYDNLKPMCDAITERGIGATVESIAA